MIDVFNDGRFIIGNLSEMQAAHNAQLALAVAWSKVPWNAKNNMYSYPIPEQYGVLKDDFDGALFFQVRQMGIRLPYWRRKEGTGPVRFECIMDGHALYMLKLAFP